MILKFECNECQSPCFLIVKYRSGMEIKPRHCPIGDRETKWVIIINEKKKKTRQTSQDLHK